LTTKVAIMIFDWLYLERTSVVWIGTLSGFLVFNGFEQRSGNP